MDLGLPNWCVMGNKYGLFSAGAVQGYDEVRAALKRWPKAIVVADSGGDLHASRQLKEDHPGRVYLAYYRADRKTMQLITWGQNEESGKVMIDRNRLLQLVMDEFRAKRIPLRGKREDWQEVWSHLCNMYRTVQEDALGQERYVWERSGHDDLIHSIGYWRVAMDKFASFTGLYVNAPTEFKPQRSFRIDPVTKGVSAKDLFPDEDEVKEDWRNL